MKGIDKTLIPSAGSSMLLIAMKRIGFLIIEIVEMRFSIFDCHHRVGNKK